MADWFVYQYDIFPNDFDPDTLGIMLIPQFDLHHRILYKDAPDICNHGLRRVQTIWGFDKNIQHMDFVLQKTSNTHHNEMDHSGAMLTHYVQWTPGIETFSFKNEWNGFKIENISTGHQLVVKRTTTGSHLTSTISMMQKNEYGHYVHLGQVSGVRIHKLVLINPDESVSWFAKFVTAKTSSIAKQ